MLDHPETIVIWPGPDPRIEAGLAELLTSYHLSTQAEKGEPVATAQHLPKRYLHEIHNPQVAFADDVVRIAVSNDTAIGCLVLTASSKGAAEIKRLWTDPAFRGRGVAARLISAALDEQAKHGPGTVRLSVWAWRTGALALYRRMGFAVVPSWDERDQLICLQRDV